MMIKQTGIVQMLVWEGDTVKWGTDPVTPYTTIIYNTLKRNMHVAAGVGGGTNENLMAIPSLLAVAKLHQSARQRSCGTVHIKILLLCGLLPSCCRTFLVAAAAAAVLLATECAAAV